LLLTKNAFLLFPFYLTATAVRLECFLWLKSPKPFQSKYINIEMYIELPEKSWKLSRYNLLCNIAQPCTHKYTHIYT